MASQLQLDTRLIRAVHRGCAQSRQLGRSIDTPRFYTIHIKRRLSRWMER